MTEIFSLHIAESIRMLLPELMLGGLILLIVILSLVCREKYKLIQAVVFSGLGIILYLDIYQMNLIGSDVFDSFFGTDMLYLNKSQLFWILVLDFFMLLITLLPLINTIKKLAGEYYILLLGILLGAHLLVLSAHMLMMFISLEVISLSSYLLVSLGKNTVEAGVKYFLFGATATAIMLYGISLWYGMTGELSLITPPDSDHKGSFLWIMVTVLISSGILFKISAVPWHLWVPEVYQKSSIPVVTTLSIIPKIAGFVLAIKWLHIIGWPSGIIAILAVVTMTIGNFVALRQTHVKRMMAYSSIAHTGFLLMGLVVPGERSYFIFYLIIYALMNMGLFTYLNYYERQYNLYTLNDFKGAFRLSPLLAIGLLVLLISLTGIPPTAGFTAKLFLFTGVGAEYMSSGNGFFLFVLVFGLVNTVVALGYYIRIPYLMIFRENDEFNYIRAKIFTLENFLGGIIVLAILTLFFIPEWLMGWINSISFVF